MTRYGYDSVSPGSIPTNAPVVFGYVDGRFAWSPGDWARFTTKTKLRIAVFPSTNDGHILDCEPGDAVPSQCPGWVKMRRAAGIDPTVYTSMSEWGQVIDAFINAGVPQPHYWIAAYPGSGEVQETLRGITSIAHQFADPPNSGGNFDKSVVVDVWPGVDKNFTPNIVREVPDMYAVVNPTGGWIHLRFGTGQMADQRTTDQNIFKNAGVLVTYPDQADFDDMMAQNELWLQGLQNAANPQAITSATLTLPWPLTVKDNGDGTATVTPKA